MAIEMDWGQDESIIEVTSENFTKNSLKYLVMIIQMKN